MSRGGVIPVVDPAGLWHDSKRAHMVGRLVITPGSYETEVAIGDLLLVSGEYRDVATLVSNTSLTVGAAYSNNANDTAPKIIRGTPRTLTGTIDAAASTTVPGVGTLFLTEVSVGDYLMLGTATAGEIRQVTAVASNTSLTVDSAFSDLANDTAPGILKASDFDRIRGTIDPAASTTVTGVNTAFLGQGLRFNFALDGPRKFNFGRPPLFVTCIGRGIYTYRFEPREVYQALSGSVDTAASVTVPGVNTRFGSELAVGDRILVGAEVRTVQSIESDTSLTVSYAHTDQSNDTSPEKIVSSPSVADGQLRIWDASTMTELSGALPAAVLNDVVRFHAIFQPGL